ncbi:MAG: hypothetical protein HYX27_08870 [Acidobacteria bacterium]|nr:hypothetical protein [Acidobacteriota bacterium]
MHYESYLTVESRACHGVRFRVRRLSLARRMELVRLIRETGEKLAFHMAGDSVIDAAQAAGIRARMDALYIRWGLDEISGLTIDGEPATIENLLERGPDSLAREIVDAVKGELFLDEDERKN